MQAIKKKNIHPATLTFQALRMFVNDELAELEVRRHGRVCAVGTVCLRLPACALGSRTNACRESLRERERESTRVCVCVCVYVDGCAGRGCARKQDGVRQALDLLGPSATLAVLTFHSLEAKVVGRSLAKYHTAAGAHGDVRFWRHGLTPSAGEVKSNPRARSALLRVARRDNRSSTRVVDGRGRGHEHGGGQGRAGGASRGR